MYKIINEKGEIFTIGGTYIYSEKQRHKGSPLENHTFTIEQIPITIILGLPQFRDFYEFNDEWAYPTKYRYFVDVQTIGLMLISEKEVVDELYKLRHTKTTSGIELYFDEIDPIYEKLIIHSKLETNPNY